MPQLGTDLRSLHQAFPLIPSGSALSVLPRSSQHPRDPVFALEHSLSYQGPVARTSVPSSWSHHPRSNNADDCAQMPIQDEAVGVKVLRGAIH